MLNLENCRAGYAQEILHRVNVRVCPKTVTALLGPNGCGKTTLLRTLARVVTPTCGALSVDGQNAARLSAQEFARAVAYLPQARPIPQITVSALVAHGRFPYLGFPRKLRAEDHEKIESALKKLGLDGEREKNLTELSGGERQRVYLAMLLAQDSRYLLLDEPTTALDIAHQLRVLSLLRTFAEEGRGVLMVLHDLASALTFADQLVVMRSGVIYASGTPDELLRSTVFPEVFRVSVSALLDASGRKHYVLSPIE